MKFNIGEFIFRGCDINCEGSFLFCCPFIVLLKIFLIVFILMGFVLFVIYFIMVSKELPNKKNKQKMRVLKWTF